MTSRSAVLLSEVQLPRSVADDSLETASHPTSGLSAIPTLSRDRSPAPEPANTPRRVHCRGRFSFGTPGSFGGLVAPNCWRFDLGTAVNECSGRSKHGRLTLLGDAAHPKLAHVEQGANQAIEDAVALAALLSRAERISAPRASDWRRCSRPQFCRRNRCWRGVGAANG
jgi:FAD binding domain